MTLRLASSALLFSLGLALTGAPRVAHATEPAPTLRVDLGGGVKLELVLIPAGTFLQGSPADEKGHDDAERQREVKLTEPYYLGKVPVTVAQFGRFVGATSYRTEAEKGSSGGSGWDGRALVQKKEFTWKSPGFHQDEEHPVTLVTYDDALAFTAWLSRTIGRAASLPTEAQWEYAYRAGTRGPYYEGKTDKDALVIGWFKENAANSTHPVAQKKPNAFGLHDMAGNVFEWCLDWYAPYPPGEAQDPFAAQADTSDKPRRVLRGGSWLKDARHGRAAARDRNAPGSRNADNGFRVAASTSEAPAPAAAPAVPVAPPTPPPAAPARSSSNCGDAAIGLGCFGTMIAAFVMFIVFVVRSFTRRPALGSAPAIEPPPVRFQVAPDGFRIFAPPTQAGWTLVYRYQGASGWQQGQVALEPSPAGQFIYTGAAPQQVQVVSMMRPPQAAGAPMRAGGAPVIYRAGVVVRETHVVHHHHQDDSFRGFPSAY